MSRAIFYTQPIDMLKKRNLDRCSNKNRVCETCAMFGIIGKQGESFSASSRIRFSDAICEDENCFDGKYNLILASPRISSFEFYLKSRSSQYCADDDGVTIAGRKYYWHHNSEIKNVDVTTANQKMVRKVELVKSGSEFTFYIYFDNITEVQLKKLVFALNLGENSLDSDKCHKIGHGKPLGLGSVKIVVDSIKMRIFRCGKYGETSGDELIADSKGDIFDNKKNVENILKVTDMNAVESGIVHYPKTDKSGDIFKWFAENRKVLKSFGASMEYYTKLPLLTDDSQELPSSPKIGKTYAGRDFGYNQNNEKSHNTFFSTVRTKESRHDKPKGKRK
jgi:CRISPR-associated protein (TIGR03986 family)